MQLLQLLYIVKPNKNVLMGKKIQNLPLGCREMRVSCVLKKKVPLPSCTVYIVDTACRQYL